MSTLKTSSNAAKSLVAIGLIATGAVGGFKLCSVNAADREPAAARAEKTALLEKTSILNDMENGFAAIAERIEPTVVSIEVQKNVSMGGFPGGNRIFEIDPNQDDSDNANPFRQRLRNFSMPSPGQTFKARGSGSGVIVSNDGWILTNDHVVEGADKVTVTLHDGRKFTGTVRRDSRSDLAVIKIAANGLKAAEFADSDKLRVGQWALAFGSPFELNDTMTVGVVSARQRQKTISDAGVTRFYPNLIQTDASINPGNSGGALVDSHGQVMGINVAINSPNGGNVGIAFAIPSNTARHVMDELIKHGKVVRGFLGVNPSALTPKERSTYGVTEGGALISSVSEGTPAAKAGLQTEDVVTKVNGQSVRDDVAFRDLIGRQSPGNAVELTVVRNHQTMTVKATLEAVPEPKSEKGEKIEEPAQPAKPKTEGRLGIAISSVSEDVRKQFNLDNSAKGVVITDVRSGSAAAEAGLQPGMVVQKVNGKSVNSPDELASTLKSMKSGEEARLVIQANKQKILVTVQIP